MATLQTQYKQWLQENPDQQLTYEQWFSKWSEINSLPIVSDDFQIGPNGAFEYDEDEINDWDVTLMDGLEDDDYEN
jgi:hypothetical protein